MKLDRKLVAGIAAVSTNSISADTLPFEEKTRSFITDISLEKIENTKERVGLHIEQSELDERSGMEFLSNPSHFLQRHGLDFETVMCPEYVHEAMKRAEIVSKKLCSLVDQKQKLDEDTFNHMREIADESFPAGYSVEIIPFGLKFIEKIDPTTLPPKGATASATITFADGDTDS